METNHLSEIDGGREVGGREYGEGILTNMRYMESRKEKIEISGHGSYRTSLEIAKDLG